MQIYPIISTEQNIELPLRKFYVFRSNLLQKIQMVLKNLLN